MDNLKIEYVSLSEIKPYEYNAKIHTNEQINQIVESIREFGMNDPIGVWNGEIVEGHGRYIAAKKIGMKTVPIIRLDNLNDEQRKAYMLIHNKLTMNTDFDFDILEKELDKLDSIDMSFYGFENIKFEDSKDEADIVEDEFTEEVETRCKLGDLWQLGRWVYCKQCGKKHFISRNS